MADTYTRILIHCIFSTKHRKAKIDEPEKLWSYVRGIARNHSSDVLAVGGTADHLHILLTLPSSLNIAQLMRHIKANSSRYLNEKQRGFAWQDGYAAISVSPSQVTAVKKYIEHQEEHHAKWSFENEYETLLDRSGVQRSPEYTFG